MAVPSQLPGRAWPGLVALAVLAGSLALAGGSAEAYPGAPWFEPSKPYTQNFPDPSIVVHDGVHYAYATATGGAYLPVMTSTDLRTWTARPAYDPGAPLNADPFFNDALPHPAAWSPARPGTGRLTKEVWAPGVARIGNRFVAFYSARQRLDRDRFCISVATSASPLGPFVDRTTAPLVCDADPNGSIDPQPFVDADGAAYLLWKSEGVPGSAPTRIWSRRLDASGTAFAPGSTAVPLLHTSQGWEGNVIENPAMIRHQGALYLFYSGNEHRSARYATGYARCASPLGPCTKHAGNPVLASRGDRLGPGGATPFIDTQGRFQLAYHWWNAPHTSYPAFPQCQSAGTCTQQGQRRLGIAQVHVTATGLQVGGAAPEPTPAQVDSVRRLYLAYFLRESDAGGLTYWSNLYAGGRTLSAISGGFAESAEFRSRYGQLSDRAFVELVYANVLGRAPDGGGLTHWTGMLGSGRTRGWVMIGFSESAEFRSLTGTR
ncbi:MAG TPA: family 43 glycosylhydrolase [Acidimicrobiales bacterium]|nr:family 43 glycosylhydrolase [Acidimicrobiales bacterium]